MAYNKDKIIENYKNYDEDKRAEESRAGRLEFHYTKKHLNEYITAKSNVIELGCGTGYYGMFFADKCAAYTGIDLSPDNIAVFHKKIAAKGIRNISAKVGDATALPEFADSCFDVVLCLGPMYHLPQEDRLKVFDECYRIAKPGAVLAFSYINGLGAYIAACVHDKGRSIYPNMATNKSILELKTDDLKPDVFFFTSSEEMENDARQKNLEILNNYGINFDFVSCAVNAMSDEQFEAYMELADIMSSSPACLGLSAHALLLCKK